MLRKPTVLLLCVFLALNIQAQNFAGGIVLGLSTSQIAGDNLGGFNKAGLLAGVFANKSISPLLSFQMEMTYIQKGSNNPDMNDYKSKNVGKPDISLNYIEVPILLQYKQNTTLKIEGGVQFANLINGYYNDSYGEITYSGTTPKSSTKDKALFLLASWYPIFELKKSWKWLSQSGK